LRQDPLDTSFLHAQGGFGVVAIRVTMPEHFAISEEARS
jgi:hypothetical protein